MSFMNLQEFNHAVATHDQRRLEALIDRIPQNINRAGAHYRKLVKQICTLKYKYGMVKI